MSLKSTQVESFIFLRHEGKFVKLNLDDILYIEAMKNYTKIKFVNKPPLTTITSFGSFTNMLPPRWFCKVHRSFIVSLGKITAFDNKWIYLPGGQIPIGDLNKRNLFDSVTVLAGEPLKERSGFNSKKEKKRVYGLEVS